MNTLKRFTTHVAFFIGLFLLGSYSSFAQVGFDNPNPDASSILDLTSTKRGLLIPRMSTNERTSILSPADGLLVFDNSLNMFFFYSKKHKRWEAMNPLVNAGQDTTNIYLETSGKKVGIGKVPATALDVNGTVQANNATITGNATVTGTTTANTFVGYGTIPLKGIIMWSGNPSDLPDGWALCNGQNINGIQTPNLSGRFIVGVGVASDPGAGPSNYQIEDQGGKERYTLTTDEMPSHNHTGTTSTNGAHRHGIPADDGGGGGYGYRDRTIKSDGDCVGCDANHYGYTDNEGNHAHSVSTNNVGGGKSFDNRPPYFALAYIMRVK